MPEPKTTRSVYLPDHLVKAVDGRIKERYIKSFNLYALELISQDLNKPLPKFEVDQDLAKKVKLDGRNEKKEKKKELALDLSLECLTLAAAEASGMGFASVDELVEYLIRKDMTSSRLAEQPTAH